MENQFHRHSVLFTAPLTTPLNQSLCRVKNNVCTFYLAFMQQVPWSDVLL